MKLHFRAPMGTRIEETEKLVLAGRGGDPQDHPGATEVRPINDMIGVPLFFNLALVPTDNISGMDADILILLKKPHKPASHYMREIRAKLPPQFPGSHASTSRTPTSSRRCSTSACRRRSTSRCRTPTSSAPRTMPGGSRKRSRKCRARSTCGRCRCSTIPRCGWTWTGCARPRLGLTQRDVANSVLMSLSFQRDHQPFLLPQSQRRELHRVGADADRQAPERGRPHVHAHHAGDRAPYRSGRPARDPRQVRRRSGHRARSNLASDQARYQLPVGQPLHGAACDRHRRQHRRPRPRQHWSRTSRRRSRQITAEKDFPETAKIIVARPVRGHAGLLPEPDPGADPGDDPGLCAAGGAVPVVDGSLHHHDGGARGA